jgi:hypothetical protein
MTDRQQFRQALVECLNQDPDTFSLARFRETHAASDDIARQAARDVFFSQCLKASKDWTITDAERQVLRQLGERLDLPAKLQTECLVAAKNRVYNAELKEALADEMISNVEADSLAHLRTTLGLAPMAAEDFGPPLVRPAPRREKLLHKSPADRERPRPTKPSWSGPWGPRSPLLGIPYTVLVLTCLACLVFGGWTAYRQQHWWPIPASLGVAVVAIFLQFVSAHCWKCGGNWCMSRADSESGNGFFGGMSTYVLYECCHCGAVRRVNRYRRSR